MGVITISRQIGSEGTFIAKRVAEQLGLSFIDKEDIEKVMHAYGFSAFEEVYNTRPGFWERFNLQRSVTIDFLLTVMRAFAKVGNVVLLGRRIRSLPGVHRYSQRSIESTAFCTA